MTKRLKQQIAELASMIESFRSRGTSGGYNPDRWAAADMRAGRDSDRDFRNQERNAGLENEPGNNVAVYINGKQWKVLAGCGAPADSWEERQYMEKMRAWAAKKSAATGKKWEVGATGERPTAEGMNEWKKGRKAPIKPRNFVAKNATAGGAGAHKDKKKDAKQGKAKHKKAPELAESSTYDRRLNVLLEAKMLTEKIRQYRK